MSKMIGNLSCVRAAEYPEDRQFTLVQWLDTHSGDHTVFVFPPKRHLYFRSKEAGCVGEIFSTLLRQQNASDHHVLQTLDKSLFWNIVGHTRVNLFPLIPHPFLSVCFFPFFRSACSISVQMQCDEDPELGFSFFPLFQNYIFSSPLNILSLGHMENVKKIQRDCGSHKARLSSLLNPSSFCFAQGLKNHLV